MLLDFSKISDEEVTFTVLPEGEYLVKCTSCESKTSSKGNEFWNVTYETKEGDKIWDSIFFTEKTLNRVKKCFKVLGLDVNGEFDYEPSDLVGKVMKASILIENYTDKNGQDKQKNVIDLWNCEPYQAKKQTKKAIEIDEEELPF